MKGADWKPIVARQLLLLAAVHAATTMALPRDEPPTGSSEQRNRHANRLTSHEYSDDTLNDLYHAIVNQRRQISTMMAATNNIPTRQMDSICVTH